MRSEFEKLPEIATYISRGFVFWDGEKYRERVGLPHVEAFVNGALYAHQEQQKVINMQECGATEIQAILNDNKCDDAVKLKRIKELLK